MTGLDGVAFELPGGWVLLAPAGTLVCAGALSLIEQAARRDGGSPSPDFTVTRQALARAAQHVRTGVNASTPVAYGTNAAPWTRMLNPVDTTAAAHMLGCTPNNVRDMCRRGVLTTATRQGRTWLVEQDEIVALVLHRGQGEDAA